MEFLAEALFLPIQTKCMQAYTLCSGFEEDSGVFPDRCGFPGAIEGETALCIADASCS